MDIKNIVFLYIIVVLFFLSIINLVLYIKYKNSKDNLIKIFHIPVIFPDRDMEWAYIKYVGIFFPIILLIGFLIAYLIPYLPLIDSIDYQKWEQLVDSPYFPYVISGGMACYFLMFGIYFFRIPEKRKLGLVVIILSSIDIIACLLIPVFKH